MTKDQIPALLTKTGFPFAYDHFAEGEAVSPPFLVYRYPKSDNFAADGRVYFKQDVLHIELYTDKKDTGLEEKVETILDENGLVYAKSEVWISSEKMYEVLYETEV